MTAYLGNEVPRLPRASPSIGNNVPKPAPPIDW